MKFIRSRDRMVELCRFLKSTVDGHVPCKLNSYHKHGDRKQKGRTLHMVFGPRMRRHHYPLPHPSQVVFTRYCSKKERKWLKRSKERTRLSIKVHIARLKEGRSGGRKRNRPIGLQTRPGYRCNKARRKHIRKSTQSRHSHKQTKKQLILTCESDESESDMTASKHPLGAPITLPSTEVEINDSSSSSYTDDEEIDGNLRETGETVGKYATSSDGTKTEPEVETDLESSDDADELDADELEGDERCAVGEIRANYLDVFPDLPQNEDNLISTSSLDEGRGTVGISRLDYLDVFPESPQNEVKSTFPPSFDGEIRVFGETSPDDSSMPSQSSHSDEEKYAIGENGFAYIDERSPDNSQDGAISTSSSSSQSDFNFNFQTTAEIDKDGKKCGKVKKPVIEESIKSSTSSETDYSFYLDADLEKYSSSSSSDEGQDPAGNSPLVHDEFIATEVDDPINDDRFAVKSRLSFDTEDPQYVKYVRDERLSAGHDDEKVDDVSTDIEEEAADVEDERVEYIDIPVADTDDENTVTQRETKTPYLSTSHAESAVDVSAHASSGISSTDDADKPLRGVHPHPASPSQSYKEPSTSTLATKQSNSRQAANSSVYISGRANNRKKETGKKVLLSKLAKRIKSANLERRVPAHVKADPLLDRSKSDSAAKRLSASVASRSSRKGITATPSSLPGRKTDHSEYLKGFDRAARDEATSGSKTNQERLNPEHCTVCPKKSKKLKKKKRDSENETNTAIDRPVLTDVEMRKHTVQCDDDSNSDSDVSLAESDHSLVSDMPKSSSPQTYVCNDKVTPCDSDNCEDREYMEPTSRTDRRKQTPLSDKNKPTSEIDRARTFEAATNADKHAHKQTSPSSSLVGKPSSAKNEGVRKKSSKKLGGFRSVDRSQISLMDIPARLTMYAPSTCVEDNKELSMYISSSIERVIQTSNTRQKRPSTTKPRSALQVQRVRDGELSKPGTEKNGVSPPNGGGLEKREEGKKKERRQPKSRVQKHVKQPLETELGLDLGRDTGTRKKKSKTKQEKLVNVTDIAPRHDTNNHPTTRVKQRKPTQDDHEAVIKKNHKQPNSGKKSGTKEDRFTSAQIVYAGP